MKKILSIFIVCSIFVVGFSTLSFAENENSFDMEIIRDIAIVRATVGINGDVTATIPFFSDTIQPGVYRFRCIIDFKALPYAQNRVKGYWRGWFSIDDNPIFDYGESFGYVHNIVPIDREIHRIVNLPPSETMFIDSVIILYYDIYENLNDFVENIYMDDREWRSITTQKVKSDFNFYSYDILKLFNLIKFNNI